MQGHRSALADKGAMRALGLVVTSVLWLAGCAVTPSVVRKQATHDLDCEQQQLTVQSEGRHYLVEGCGLQALYACSREAGAQYCTRIGQRGVPVAWRERIVRAKASRSLDCDPEAINIEASRHYLARGCGQRIHYECVTRGDCCAFTTPGAQPEDADEDPILKRARQQIDEARSRDDGAKRGLSKLHIRAVIEASIDQVRACYEAELHREGHAGIVVVQFVIAPDGHVQVASIYQSSLGVPKAEQCIGDVFKGLRFAAPEGGGIVVVTYPFVLQMTPPGPHTACP